MTDPGPFSMELTISRASQMIAESSLAASFLQANPSRYLRTSGEFTLREEKLVDYELLRQDVADYLSGQKQRARK